MLFRSLNVDQEDSLWNLYVSSISWCTRHFKASRSNKRSRFQQENASASLNKYQQCRSVIKQITTQNSIIKTLMHWITVNTITTVKWYNMNNKSQSSTLQNSICRQNSMYKKYNSVSMFCLKV